MYTVVTGDCLAEALSQVGMTARPIEDPRQQRLRLLRRSTRKSRLPYLQPDGQNAGLFEGKVVELDTSADVEGRRARVADKVRGRGHPQQTERQPAVLGVLRPAVVGLPDGGEELVRRERQ